MVIFLLVTGCNSGISDGQDVIDTPEHSTSVSEFGEVGYKRIEAVFSSPADYSEEITRDDMETVKSVIESRLVLLGINDYEVRIDYSAFRVDVEFKPPSDIDSEDGLKKILTDLSEMALLTFREGESHSGDSSNLPIILAGKDIKKANAIYEPLNEHNGSFAVSLEFNDSGAEAFEEATTRLSSQNYGVISIWLDDTLISAPKVTNPITGGFATITGGGSGFTLEEATSLANKINLGSLPFVLTIESYEAI